MPRDTRSSGCSLDLAVSRCSPTSPPPLPDDSTAAAARSLIEQCEAAGDDAAAAQWARRTTRLAPHDEDVVRRFIALLDRLGDRAGAVAAYDDFAECLRVDLETEPAAETKALITAVRERQTAAPVELSHSRLGRVTQSGGRRWRSVAVDIVGARLPVSGAG